MKKFLIALAMVCTSVLAFAEASFDQIESLIEKQQYSAAASGLEGIIKNHPNSAKAFYAMAQAQAGLGNLEKARYALDKAKGLDPDLKFASKSNVESLEIAITPQTKKIEAVEESHFWRNLLILLILCGGGYAAWRYFFRDDGDAPVGNSNPNPSPVTPPSSNTSATQPKTETPKSATVNVPPASTSSINVSPSTYSQPAYSAPSHTTVVHTSSSDGLVTGMVLGHMMSGNHHHDSTRVIEREVIREVPAAPAPSRDSSWDDNSSSSSSKSSSWDTPSSSSSSWGSSSSSSSSDSSWGSSDSSSSSSDSSSSWD